jgi:tetratricopeptide (TPR) repeat protein
LNAAALEHYQRVLDLCAISKAPADGRELQALVESGKVYEVIGNHARAAERFRDAVECAKQLGCSPRELARIQFLLCKAITARHRPSEYIPIAEESLRILRNDSDSPEAVFAEFVLAYGSFQQGEYRPACEFAALRGELFKALPYSQDLAINSGYLAWANFLDKNDSEAMQWLDWLEREARLHNDLVSLAAAHVRRGRDMLAQRGDLDHAIEELEQAGGMYRKVGARYLEGRCCLYEGDVYYRYGRLDPAEECLRRAEILCNALDHHVHMRSEVRMLRGQIALSRGDATAAIGDFRAGLASQPGAPWELLMQLLIGSALILQGRLEEAAHVFPDLLGDALTFRLPPAYSDTISLAHVLSLLENCEAHSEVFQEFCDRLRRERPESGEMLSSWHLEPETPGSFPRRVVVDGFAGPSASGWSWHDQYGDCRRAMDKVCVITAPVGRGMRGSNLSAPRLLRPVRGRFTVQALCAPPEDGRLAVGGLALWKSQRDYLRLDVGSLAPHNVAFGGCIDNRDIVVGRGRLPAGPLWLRLERTGPTVSALCSPDGAQWYSVGSVSFPVEDPVDVGLFVDGMVRPEIYPRAYAAGSEGRFASFELLEG